MLAAMGDAKTRTFVIIGGVILAIIIIYALTQIGGDELEAGDPSRTAGVPSSVKGIPGQATPERYAELLREENLTVAQQAELRGGSAIPTIVGQSSDSAGGFGDDGFGSGAFGPGSGAFGAGGQGGAGFGNAGQFGEGGEGNFGGAGAGGSGLGAFGRSGQGSRRSADEIAAERRRQAQEDLDRRRAERERQKELERLRKLAEAERNRYQQDLQQRAASMAQYAQALGTVWAKVTPQVLVQGVLASDKGQGTGDEDGSKDSTKVEFEKNADGTIKTDQDGLPVVKKDVKELIKAGTILFGVLDTAINTDEPSPVLATIVHGKYKGSRLIGSIERPENGEKVIVTFRTMNIPNREKSFSMNAVAIDPDTARTALASDVDHHYLLRYGSLFASAFMQGYGQSVTQQGTVTTSPNGTTQETKPDLSGSEQFWAALGKVGEEWGNAVRPLFDRPITVTVDQGLGLGLLFLSDVDVTPTEG